MNRNRLNFFKLILCSLSLASNIILSFFVETFKIPFLFMSTIGTMFTAVFFGPLAGALVGFSTNLLQAILFNPKDLPFAIVSVVLALIFGFTARYFLFNYKIAFITGLISGIICPLIGTPIAIFIYGGLTGGGIDFLFLWLLKSGHSLFSATFLPRLYSNLIDKIFCALLVALFIKTLTPQLLKKSENPQLITKRCTHAKKS